MVDHADPTVQRAQARVGRVLRDKWHLDRLIGVGGMAAVYAATHRNAARVAVKMLHPELSLDTNVRGRFLREGYVGNSIEHRGVVMVLDDDVADDGSAFLVMELLDGETLEGRRERHGGKLEAGEVLSIMDQLLDVLVAAHAKGVVHRDLKPENVFLTVDGVVKVLDFGIARVRQLSTASTATRTGTAMGTPAFMPPEQARGRWDYVDAQSDLWAVGATMIMLLTGKLVHEAETVNEQLLLAMTTQCPSLSTFGSFPPGIVHVVDRAVAYDKAQRWPDAATMQEAVREAYYGLFSAPLSNSPKLSAPSSVFPTAGTIIAAPTPHAMVAATAAMVATDGAVAKGQTGVAFDGGSKKVIPVWVWALVGSTAAILAFMAVVVIRGTSQRPKGMVGSSGAGSTTEAASSSPSASAASVPRREPEVIDITSLPVANDPPKDRVPVVVDAGAVKPVPDAGRPTATVPVPGTVTAKKTGPAPDHDSLDTWK